MLLLRPGDAPNEGKILAKKEKKIINFDIDLKKILGTYKSTLEIESSFYKL